MKENILKRLFGLAKWFFGLLSAFLSPFLFYWANTGDAPHVFEEILSFLENAGVENIWFSLSSLVGGFMAFALGNSFVRFYFFRWIEQSFWVKVFWLACFAVLFLVIGSLVYILWFTLVFSIPDQHLGWVLLVVAIISSIVLFFNFSKRQKDIGQYLKKKFVQKIKEELPEEFSAELINSLDFTNFEKWNEGDFNKKIKQWGDEHFQKKLKQLCLKKSAEEFSKEISKEIIEEDDEYFQIELLKDGVWGEGKIIIRRSDYFFSAVDISWEKRALVNYKDLEDRNDEIRNRKMLEKLEKALSETKVALAERMAENEKVSKKTLEKILRQLKELKAPQTPKTPKAPRKKSSPRKRSGEQKSAK